MKQDSPHTQQLSFLAPNLIDQLNPKHPLLQLAKRIPWEYFEAEFAQHYAHTGRPGKPIRLMVGLSILKHMENLSDERIVFKTLTTKRFAERLNFSGHFRAIPPI